MDQTNIIDLKKYRKLKRSKSASFALRVHYDDSAYDEALKLIIFSCAFASISFFFIFYYLHKFIN
ncbi:hypothetical protein [Bacillus sp. EAC]|uniref:hypothetical protein n=1 Tax=Bacillus sp. EAC TaxID=1978338 RepID=UPI000B43D175|nr:hypothetical protein [Bacillus sp. EAC]